MFCYSKEHCPRQQFCMMENLHLLSISYCPYNKYLNNLLLNGSNHQEYFLLQETHPYHPLKSSVKKKIIIFWKYLSQNGTKIIGKLKSFTYLTLCITFCNAFATPDFPFRKLKFIFPPEFFINLYLFLRKGIMALFCIVILNEMARMVIYWIEFCFEIWKKLLHFENTHLLIVG